jgi:hypothetical protein
MDAAFLTPPEIVTWAYRLLLGREPESEEVVLTWARGAAPTELRDAILGSEEMAREPPAGRPLRLASDEVASLEAAARAVLALLGGEPMPDAAEALAASQPSIAALRRYLLAQPEIAALLPQGAVQNRRTLWLEGRQLALEGGLAEPGLRSLPRLPALLRAALGATGEGAVILDGAAGVGGFALTAALALPRFANVLAFEADPRRAAHLVVNIAAQGAPDIRVAATALPALASLRLPRIDLLHLEDPDRVAEAAPYLAAGALLCIALDLRRELAPGRPAPAARIEDWRRRFGAPVAWGVGRAVFALDGDAATERALNLALDDPEHRLELALGGSVADI